MDYSVTIEMNEAYFKESFEQWLTHKSKLRRWQIHLGIFIFIIGAGLMINEPGALSVTISVIGLIEIVEFYFYRRRWVQLRIQARLNNLGSFVEIRVGNSGMYHKGPNSEGTIGWGGIKEAIPTEKGLVIALQDSMSVYIPDTSMKSPKFKEFVLGKIKGDECPLSNIAKWSDASDDG